MLDILRCAFCLSKNYFSGPRVKITNRRLITFTLIALICSISLAEPTKQFRTLSIIPEPQRIELLEGSFTLSTSTTIVLAKGTSARERFAAEQLQSEIQQAADIKLKIADETKKNVNQNCIILTNDSASQFIKETGLILTQEMKDEGYILSVTNRRVVVGGATSHGVFNGVMSLCQMLQKEEAKIILPAVKIRDWPMMPFRGISDDMSRGQSSTMDNLKYIIKTLARYKYNVYSPYIEDIFAFKKYPAIWKNRGALTKEQIGELEDFADHYYIEIIPIFETLGHFENILLKPEFQKYADFPGAQALNVTNEETYKFLQDLIDDIATAFRSTYFNMAADESYDIGLGASKEFVSKTNLATVHAEHYKRVIEMLSRHNKKVMMYADMMIDNPDLFEKLPKDITLVYWRYNPLLSYPQLDKIKTTGFRFIVSPANWNFINPFTNYASSLPNIQNLIREGYKDGAIGALISNWGDYGGETLREFNWYGNAWGAECCWSPLKSNIARFNRKFFKDFYGTDSNDMELLYSLLTSENSLMYWSEVWRHPFLPVKDETGAATRVVSIEASIPLLQKLLRNIEDEVTRNKDHIQYLQFATHLYEWYANKIMTANEIERICAEKPDSEKIDHCIERCINVCDDLKNLKEEFKTVWLKNYREDNLDLLLNRYDRQIAYWQEKIGELQRNQLNVNPEIESSTISAPFGYHNDGQTKKTFFRKEFILDNKPNSALLQLIGDSWAKLYVNDSLAGEVMARRSLSLIVENERVKLIDISPLLKSGKNVIAAEVQNFDKRGWAALNIYAEIKTDSGIQKIRTDTSWKVSEKFSPNWTSTAFQDIHWHNAVSKDNGWTIIRPNFETHRKSWIER